MITTKGEARRYFDECLEIETDDCIVWKFTKFENGYGSIKYKGRPHRVHRLALSMKIGSPPQSNSLALHKPLICHNRLCFNYKHLEWGDQKTNVSHKLIDNTSNRGERHGKCKLSIEDVISIRKSKKANKDLAVLHRVSPSSISKIKKGVTWAWLG